MLVVGELTRIKWIEFKKDVQNAAAVSYTHLSTVVKAEAVSRKK